MYKKLGTGISFNKGRPVLNIYARDEKNEKVTVPVENLPIYFYVKDDVHIEDEDMKKVIRTSSGYVSIYGDMLKKVFVRKISDMRKLSRIYHGFEGDINWDKKMCLDLKITDYFYYEDKKVYSLDKRFLGSEVHKSGDVEVSSEVEVTGLMDNDKLVGLANEAEAVDFKFRHCCVDIEVIVEDKEKLRTYDGEIVCAVIYDNFEDKYHCLRSNDVGGERQLIKDIWQVIKEKKFDIITGWNVEFDVKWLIKRAEFYGIDLSEYNRAGDINIFSYTNKAGVFIEDIKIPGIAIMDGQELYIKQTATTEKRASYSLKAIAVAEKFPEWEDFGSKIKTAWAENPDQVVEYCRIDVERTYQIIEKKGLLKNAVTLCSITGANLDESMWNSKVIDSMLFLYKGNRILPNIVYRTEEKNIEGARVIKSIKGVHHNVGIFDAASLYPSIITGLNISGETLVKTGEAPSLYKDDYYHVKVNVNGEDRKFSYVKPEYKVGLLPEIVTELRKLRERIRADRMKATEAGNTDLYKQLNDEEKVTKGLLASVYGVTGFSSFRLYNEDCANTITGVARGVVIETLDKLQSDEFNIIYGDTDSVFIQMSDYKKGFEAMDKINKIMLDYVNGFGVKERVISMNYEKFFDWVMFSQEPSVKLKSKIRRKEGQATKKKYIGYISYVQSGPRDMKATKELYYKGFELRRSDASPALKRVMKEFFTRMENGDYKASADYLKEVKSEFSTYSMNDIAMPRSVNKIEAKGPHPDGVRYAQQHLGFEFRDDELPKLIYVKRQSKYPKTDVICYQEQHRIPDEFEIDYDVMFDKLIKKKFEPILEALNLHWDTAVSNQGTLDTWC